MFDYKMSDFGMVYGTKKPNSNVVFAKFMDSGYTKNIPLQYWKENKLIDNSRPWLFGIGYGDIPSKTRYWNGFRLLKCVWIRYMGMAYRDKTHTIDPVWHDFRKLYASILSREDLVEALKEGYVIEIKGNHICIENLYVVKGVKHEAKTRRRHLENTDYRSENAEIQAYCKENGIPTERKPGKAGKNRVHHFGIKGAVRNIFADSIVRN